MISLFQRRSLWQKLIKQKHTYLAKETIPTEIAEALRFPLPQGDSAIKELSFLVFDLETTGRDAKEDQILSIGWIEINQGNIDIQSAQHFYINNSLEVKKETAVINHIVPAMLSEGEALQEVLCRLLVAAKNRTLIVHGKSIEQSFLNHYMDSMFSLPPLPLAWIDTLSIETNIARKLGMMQQKSQQLHLVRERYKLPRYAAHNALIDSLATAELFLAQTQKVLKKENQTIENIYKYSI